MEKVLYSKFSNQRRQELEISTAVIEDKEKKYVVKSALYPGGMQHIKNMLDYQGKLRELFDECGWKLASCTERDAQSIEIEFIDGVTLEKIINEKLAAGEYEQVYSILSEIADKLYSNSHTRKFEITDEFKQIFGDIEFDHELKALPISDIDMIFSNFLVKNDIYTLIDYEWVFDFPIPLEFILFRSLFHNALIQQLEQEEKRKIYECLKIEISEIINFERMEYSFQDYVKGPDKDLGKLYELINHKAISLGNLNGETSVNHYSLYIGTERVIDKSSCEKEIKIDVSGLLSTERIQLNMNCYNGVYKLNFAYGFSKGKEEPLKVIGGNRDIVIIDDYYFVSDKPYIIFKNKSYESIRIKYTVLSKANNLMPNIVTLINNEKKERDEKIKYKNAYEEACGISKKTHFKIIRKIGAGINSVIRKQ